MEKKKTTAIAEPTMIFRAITCAGGAGIKTVKKKPTRAESAIQKVGDFIIRPNGSSFSGQLPASGYEGE